MFNAVSMLGNTFWNVVTGLFSFLPKLMYLISTSFMTIIDVLQLFFRKIVGLDTYYVTTDGVTSQQTGDIIEEFIKGTFTNKYPVLNNVFWSFIILGVIMLFLTTLIAIIRNEYTPEKDGSNSKSKVIGRSFKALVTFAIVPVVVLFGVYLGNVILKALDSVTSSSSASEISDFPKDQIVQYKSDDTNRGSSDSYIAISLFGFDIPTNSTPFSGLAFKISAYRSNRVRVTSETKEFLNLLNNNEVTNWGVFTGQDTEEVAALIDIAFANNLKFSSARTLNYDSSYQQSLNISAIDIVSGADCIAAASSPFQTLSRYRVAVVWYYYDLWQFDFILSFAILVTMGVFFLNIVIGLMKRLFEVVGLFLVSPPVVALMPLDDGSAFGKWKGKFIAKMIGAYGAVVGMNIVFLLMPYIYQIKFFNITFVDWLIQSLFAIVGLITVKSFVALLNEMVGGEDVAKAGADISKEVGSTIQKAGTLTMGAAGLAAKVGGITSGVGLVGKAGITGIKAGVQQRQFKKEEQKRQEEEQKRQETLANAEASANLYQQKVGIQSKINSDRQDIRDATGKKDGELRKELREKGENASDEAKRYAELGREQKTNGAAIRDYKNAAAQGLIPTSNAGSAAGGSGSAGGGSASSSGKAENKQSFGKRWASNFGQSMMGSLKGVGNGMLKTVGGMFGEMFSGSDLYKGWKDEGGLERIAYTAQNNDVTSGGFKKAKERKSAGKKVTKRVPILDSNGKPIIGPDGKPETKEVETIEKYQPWDWKM